MKLDWYKITRKLKLTESASPATLVEKLSLVRETLLQLRGKDKVEEFKIQELIEDLSSLKELAKSTDKELNELKNRVKLLEENLIDDLLE